MAAVSDEPGVVDERFARAIENPQQNPLRIFSAEPTRLVRLRNGAFSG